MERVTFIDVILTQYMWTRVMCQMVLGQNPRPVSQRMRDKDGAPSGSLLIESVAGGDGTVFLQPLYFFPYFDFAVPGILAQAVAFAGED